jgi:putative hemolysin
MAALARVDVVFMKFNIKRNLAVLLALLIVGLLILGYFALQQGQQNQTHNGNTTNQTQNGNTTNNQTQNGNNTGQQNQTQNENDTIANPASVYCVQNGGVYKIVIAADGNQSVVCVFSDGSQCDEWAYYRKTCSPSHSIVHPPSCNDTNCGACTNQTECAARPLCHWDSVIAACTQKCSDSNCWACINQTECAAHISCQWDLAINFCNQKPPSCSDTCVACRNQTECIAHPACQWDPTINVCSTKPPTCSGTTCQACTTQPECTAHSTCQWNSETLSCNTKPPSCSNLNCLYESDFRVVDYSIPNLLTNQKPFEMPPPPEDSNK